MLAIFIIFVKVKALNVGVEAQMRSESPFVNFLCVRKLLSFKKLDLLYYLDVFNIAFLKIINISHQNINIYL